MRRLYAENDFNLKETKHMKFAEWSNNNAIAIRPEDFKECNNENLVLNQKIINFFENHHYCLTTECWVLVNDLDGYACFVAHIDPECPGDTDDEYFGDRLELTDEERAWLTTY